MEQSQPEQEATKRAKRSRNRGRGFETQVLKKLWSLGYKKASRMVLSGANLKKPYDVIVPPFRLKIEAKRRMGAAIILEDKWIGRISQKYIVAFAVGPRISATNRVHSISLAENHGGLERVEMLKNKTIHMKDGKFVICRPRTTDAVIVDSFCIMHAGRWLLVQDFEYYMRNNWPLIAPIITEPTGENNDS